MKENKRKCFKCGLSPSEDPRVILHRFPRPGRTNSLRCELWAKYCFPHGSWHSPELQKKLYSEHRMLCNKHFKRTSFIDEACTKLFKNSAPDEETDKVLSTPTVDLYEASAFEPVAGPSRIMQPLLNNINILNRAQSSQKLLTNQLAEPQEDSKMCHSTIQDPEIKKRKCLMRKCKKYLKKIHRLHSTIKNLKNKTFITELSKNDSVNKFLQTKLPPTFALLLQGQMKNYKIKTNARRWDTDTKIIALRLYKRSPMCYKLLRRMICLPAPSTLKGLLNKFKFGVGINQQIFDLLNKKTKKAETPSENEYILMFDEMSIRKNIQYNEKEDMIDGFQDHAAQGRTSQIASYALVFMIAGVRKKVKQPVAFYLSGGSVTADRLAVILKEILQRCFDSGINICATVCDLDGVNRKAVKILGACVEQPIMIIKNHEVVVLFDTPHLLKSFRNLFLKYDIECSTSIGGEIGIGVAKWAHIKEFYEVDNVNTGFVFAPCLRQDHLNPNCKQKMKVKLAAQVLSHSVAAGMYARISKGELSAEAVITADLISKMDQLFDSVNAYTPDRRRGKPLATNLRRNTNHIKFYTEMKYFFKNLKFLGCRSPPPSQEGWVWTLNGLERVWRNLINKHRDVKSLATRRFQQDALENLFGCIRGSCGANTNPNTGQFVAGLKTAILSNLSHISIGNCETDENNTVITNYKKLLSPATDMSTANAIELTLDNIDYSFNLDFKEESNLQACAYVCGFIIKNNPNKKCGLCKEMFVSESQLQEHTFITFKEYDEIKKSLVYPTKQLICCVQNGATLINNILENEGHKKGLKKYAQEIMIKQIDFNFLKKCDIHKDLNVQYLMKSIFLITIKRFCILKNRQFVEEYAKLNLKKKMDTLKHK